VSARFEIAESVAIALAERSPVVALESTAVTHGLPHPQGVEAARDCEARIVEAGALPATIGILDGAIRVGLTGEEILRLATAPSGSVAKLNPSNLAARLAAGGL
jgi:pseudouridine-5'-phosphate glycosidase